jgi:hypothetical protein
VAQVALKLCPPALGHCTVLHGMVSPKFRMVEWYSSIHPSTMSYNFGSSQFPQGYPQGLQSIYSGGHLPSAPASRYAVLLCLRLCVCVVVVCPMHWYWKSARTRPDPRDPLDLSSSSGAWLACASIPTAVGGGFTSRVGAHSLSCTLTVVVLTGASAQGPEIIPPQKKSAN